MSPSTYILYKASAKLWDTSDPKFAGQKWKTKELQVQNWIPARACVATIIFSNYYQ